MGTSSTGKNCIGCSFCVLTNAAVLCRGHKVSPCSQIANGFKPDRGFIFRFGGSAVVYHGKMK